MFQSSGSQPSDLELWRELLALTITVSVAHREQGSVWIQKLLACANIKDSSLHSIDCDVLSNPHQVSWRVRVRVGKGEGSTDWHDGIILKMHTSTVADRWG